MSACQACANPASGRADMNCRLCRIREIARSPAFFESERAGQRTVAYRQALEAEFGDAWAAGHDEVKAEAVRIFAMKASP